MIQNTKLWDSYTSQLINHLKEEKIQTTPHNTNGQYFQIGLSISNKSLSFDQGNNKQSVLVH